MVMDGKAGYHCSYLLGGSSAWHGMARRFGGEKVHLELAVTFEVCLFNVLDKRAAQISELRTLHHNASSLPLTSNFSTT